MCRSILWNLLEFFRTEMRGIWLFFVVLRALHARIGVMKIGGSILLPPPIDGWLDASGFCRALFPGYPGIKVYGERMHTKIAWTI